MTNLNKRINETLQGLLNLIQVTDSAEQLRRLDQMAQTILQSASNVAHAVTHKLIQAERRNLYRVEHRQVTWVLARSKEEAETVLRRCDVVEEPQLRSCRQVSRAEDVPAKQRAERPYWIGPEQDDPLLRCSEVLEAPQEPLVEDQAARVQRALLAALVQHQGRVADNPSDAFAIAVVKLLRRIKDGGSIWSGR